MRLKTDAAHAEVEKLVAEYLAAGNEIHRDKRGSLADLVRPVIKSGRGVTSTLARRQLGMSGQLES
jgi:hypothetical protein